MRTIKQLYEILFGEIKDKEAVYSICVEMQTLFGRNNYRRIRKHFLTQRTLHPEFMTSERNWGNGLFWWTEKEDENPINRKAFIQKIISTL